MAPCCRTPCSCLINAGTGVTVTGDGQVGTPFVISAVGGDLPVVTAPDTNTVDQAVTGTGAPATPYVITTNVKVDATPPGGGTNLIGSGPEGLYVECAGVRGCISAGDGLDYDPATGVMEAQISADAGNMTTIGADGGLYSPAGSTLVQAGDTPTIDATVTGTGAPATPYVVTAAVRLDATPPGGGTNLIGVGPDGLYVECAGVRGCISAGDGLDYDPATGVMEAQISVAAGNIISIGPDGGLLSTGGTGLTAPDTSTVDQTLTGNGAGATPYVLTSNVKVDATPPGGGTNLLGVGPDGLYVECAGVRGCISAGDGIDYDPATGVVEAQLSTDPANTITIAPDGGLLSTGSASTVVQPLDTPTIDATVTGTGAPATPYVVSAAVRLDATPPGGGTNLIGSGAEGLYVECAGVRGCISAGDGLDYDPATGVMEVQLSTDPSNTATIAPDGGLLVPAGASTVVQPLDTPTIDATVTGTGAPATPYVVSAAVRLDATPPGGGTNLITAGPDGLYLECAQVRTCLTAGDGAAFTPATGEVEARLSTDVGNTVVFGTDGGLLVTPVPLVTGCGLDGTGLVGDPLIVAPSAGQEAWPWACDVVAESGTKCDPATGQIWSPPEHFSAMDHVYVDHFVGGIAAPITATGGWVIIDPGASQQFNIPPNFIGNNCRRWGYEITATGTFDITHTPDAVFQLGYVVQQDAVPLQVRPGWGLLTARGGAARRVVRNVTANETLWDILPGTGSFTVMYPAINVVSGSVTIASWVTDATIDTQTNQG